MVLTYAFINLRCSAWAEEGMSENHIRISSESFLLYLLNSTATPVYSLFIAFLWKLVSATEYTTTFYLTILTLFLRIVSYKVRIV